MLGREIVQLPTKAKLGLGISLAPRWPVQLVQPLLVGWIASGRQGDPVEQRGLRPVKGEMSRPKRRGGGGEGLGDE